MTLVAGGTVGAPGNPLSVFRTLDLNITAPGGSTIVEPLIPGIALPPLDTTVGLVDTVPVLRPTYVPPEDVPEAAPPAPAPAIQPVVVASGGALDTVIATPAAAPVVSNQGGSIGGRDNILLSTLRANTVRGEPEASSSSDDGVVVVEDDSSDPEKRGSRSTSRRSR